MEYGKILILRQCLGLLVDLVREHHFLAPDVSPSDCREHELRCW